MSTDRLGPVAFAQAARDYLDHYRALGLRYRGTEQVLRAVGGYLLNQGAIDLDHSSYEGWRATRTYLHSNSRRKSEQIVHHFCRYRRRFVHSTFVPSPDGFSRLRPYVRPVIVGPEQIVRMMEAAGGLSRLGQTPLRPAAVRVAVV